MKEPFDGNNSNDYDHYDEVQTAFKKLLGLGDNSLHKTYFSMLQQKLANLEDLERNLSAVMNNVFDGILIHNFEGKIIYMTDRALKMYECTMEQVLNHNIDEFRGWPADLKKENDMWNSLKYGDYHELEFPAKKPLRNELFMVQVTICRIVWYGQNAILATVRDISEQKKNEEILKESEERYRLLFQNMIQGFSLNEVILDDECNVRDYRVIDANKAFARLVNTPVEELIGKKISELYPDIDKALLDNFRKVALNGEVATFEMYLTLSNRYVDAVVFSPKKGQFAQVWSDITEIKENKKALETALKDLESVNTTLEDKVRERTQQLEQLTSELQYKISELQITQTELVRSEKLASLGELVAGVAHEINTPIGVSVTAASYLEESLRIINAGNSLARYDPDISRNINKWGETARIILSNLERAARLIKSFKQVSVDQTVDIVRTIDLRDYVNEIITSLMPSFRKTRHKIENDIKEGIFITSYPGAISQILTNLIVNSLTHAFVNIESGTIRITAGTGKGLLQLAFSDNGAGMDEETQKRMFNPFFTTKRNTGGTGLGLFIVHNLVTTQLKGRIECISKPGEGSTFYITIPFQKK